MDEKKNRMCECGHSADEHYDRYDGTQVIVKGGGGCRVIETNGGCHCERFRPKESVSDLDNLRKSIGEAALARTLDACGVVISERESNQISDMEAIQQLRQYLDFYANLKIG